MKSKRIFIVSKYALFSRGLESLLKQEHDLEIVGQESDVARAVDQIKKLQPDVIILDSDEPILDFESEVLRCVLDGNLDTKIVGLSLQNNKIYVYSASQWVVRGVTDLTEAIAQTPA